MPEAISSTIRALALLISILALAYGAYLRIGDQGERSLWVDEAWRAQQIVHASSYGELLSGHYFGHEAPVSRAEYLFGKGGLKLFGKKEIAFRLWSVFFSLLSLYLFWRISGLLFEPATAALGTFLFAVNFGSIQHAYEFKTYSFEIACALGVTLFALRAEGRRSVTALSYALFLAILALFTDLFIFFSFLPLLCIFSVSDRRHKLSALQWAALAVPFALFAFTAVVRAQSFNRTALFDFWAPYMLADAERAKTLFSDVLPHTLQWYVLSPLALPAFHFSFSLVLLILAVVISPLVMIRKESPLAAFIVFPALFQLALSMLGIYPLFARVGAFYYPLILLSLMYLLDLLLRLFFPASRPVLHGTLLALLAVGMIQFSMAHPRDTLSPVSINREDSKKVLEVLNQEAFPGDVVALNYSAQLVTAFYDIRYREDLTFVKVPPKKILNNKQARTFLLFLQEAYSDKQIWFLQTHGVAPQKMLLQVLSELGVEPHVDIQAKGASLLGFQFPASKSASNSR